MSQHFVRFQRTLSCALIIWEIVMLWWWCMVIDIRWIHCDYAWKLYILLFVCLFLCLFSPSVSPSHLCTSGTVFALWIFPSNFLIYLRWICLWIYRPSWILSSWSRIQCPCCFSLFQRTGTAGRFSRVRLLLGPVVFRLYVCRHDI